MEPLRVVAIGGSAGSIEALQVLLRELPCDFPAAVLVVVHIPSNSTSLLPGILTRAGPMTAEAARQGAVLRPGRIYVAPPNFHMLAEAGEGGGRARLALSLGPRENRHRPAIDPTFRSVAQVFGPGATGVVLSGHLDDGAAGLGFIASHGGHTLVQAPASAGCADMPENAIREARPEWVLPPVEIAAKLVELAADPRPDASGRLAHPSSTPKLPPPLPSGFTCPECHGDLFLDPNARLRGQPALRCRVGHAYGWDSLAEYSDGVESALWIAMRSLREKAALARRLAQRPLSPPSRKQFQAQAVEADAQADRVRDLVESLTDLLVPLPGGERNN